mgnify:FL=1
MVPNNNSDQPPFNNGHGNSNGYNGYSGNGSGHGRGNTSPSGNNFNKNNVQPDDDEIDLGHLFHILWQNKWKIIGITSVFTILAAIVAIMSTPIYESNATLMIKQSQNSYSQTGSDLSGLLSSTYGLGVGSTVANEVEIIKSRSLSREVAQELKNEPFTPNGRIYPILWRAYPEDSTLVGTDTVANRIRQKLEVEHASRETDIVDLRFQSPLPNEAMRVINIALNTYSELSTRQNRKSASNAVDFLNKERKELRKRLSLAEDSLRAFMNENHFMQVDAQTKELIQNLADLESKKQEIVTKLVAANSGLEKYRNQLDEIEPGLAEQFSDAVGPKLQRYQFKLAELETEKLLLISENPNIRKQQPENPELKRINEKISVVRDEIKRVSENVLAKSDQYAAFLSDGENGITQQLSSINQRLLELQIEQNQFEAQKKVINERLDELNRQFDNLPDNIMDLAKLQRNVTITEDLFLTISKQTAETALWEQTQFGLGRTIDDAFYPEKPVAPQKKLYVVIGFLLGGIISVGYIFIEKMMNNKIDGVEKLKQRDLSILSVIPDFEKFSSSHKTNEQMVEISDIGDVVSHDLVSLLDAISPSAEAFRRLHNNIVHSTPDKHYKTLMITSPSKGDGKTTVFSNLAVVMAEAGSRVLVLDLDLRRPNVHKTFGLNRSNGISELLFDQIDFDQAVKTTAIENIDIITCGQKVPNPAALLKSNELQKLIKKLSASSNYDHILIDSPPYGIISDTAPIIHLADGLVLVSRFGKTEEVALDQTIEHLNHINANILGTVLTAFNQKESSDYYYSSNYNNYDYLYSEYKDYLHEES